MIGMALGSVIGVVLLAMQGILGGTRPEATLAWSKMETRTLSVPKSTPATMLMT